MLEILAYNAEVQGKSVSLICSDGRQLTTDSWSDLITFLLMPTDMVVVSRLDRFVDAISAIMPTKTKRELEKGGRIFLPDGVKLYHQFGRIFGITYAGREANIYALNRYSDKEITDVKQLATLAQKVVKAFEAFGVKATKLSSPVSVYSSVLNSLSFSRACDLPDSALGLTNQCSQIMGREWREIYKLGHWQANEITDLDINAAYPSIISQLPELRQSSFWESETMPTEFSWGVLVGKLKIFKPVSPFTYIGERDDLITTEMLGLLRHYGIGDMQMERGWFLQLPKYYARPFQHIMQRLYRQRSDDDSLVAKIAKAISVGIGGRFSQTFSDNGKLKLGEDFNSIYSLMMTSRCMIKVCDFIYRNSLEDRVVSVMVDGVLVEGERLELPDTNEMGSWRANPKSPALVLSLLYQWLNDKKPNGKYYGEMMELIRLNPDNSVYGDVDFNLLEYTRKFSDLPRTGGELLGKKYSSEPYEMQKALGGKG